MKTTERDGTRQMIAALPANLQGRPRSRAAVSLGFAGLGFTIVFSSGFLQTENLPSPFFIFIAGIGVVQDALLLCLKPHGSGFPSLLLQFAIPGLRPFLRQP